MSEVLESMKTRRSIRKYLKLTGAKIYLRVLALKKNMRVSDIALLATSMEIIRMQFQEMKAVSFT